MKNKIRLRKKIEKVKCIDWPVSNVSNTNALATFNFIFPLKFSNHFNEFNTLNIIFWFNTSFSGPNNESKDCLSKAINITFVKAEILAARGSPVINALSPKYSPWVEERERESGSDSEWVRVVVTVIERVWLYESGSDSVWDSVCVSVLKGRGGREGERKKKKE